jgi:hypothetical protein
VTAFAAILAGALLLAWAAALNGYPLVFIDTVSYLHHTTLPETPWDKTQAYGPFLHLFHWQVTLWPAVIAQGLIASHLVWLAQRMLAGAARPGRHLLVCLALAGLTGAPWFLATLMPDALTALAPLCLLLLGFGRLSRAEAGWVTLVGAVAIAAHLSHLPTALAVLAVVGVVGFWRGRDGGLGMAPPPPRPSPASAGEGEALPPPRLRGLGALPRGRRLAGVGVQARRYNALARATLPFALAIAFLLGSNLLAFGRASLSPHGSVFLLARLQADGPAARVIRDRCPDAGWHLCAFAALLPMDSDEFLWDGTSPLNRNADGSPRPMGGVAGAAEARAIVGATLAAYPLDVARAMIGNAARQLVMLRVGDTLSDEHLAASARLAIASGFPPRELAAFDAGLQMRGALPGAAAPFLAPHIPVLILAALAAPVLLWRAARAGDRPRVALLAGALVALLANAAATGALSKPHHRYEARIAWLLPLAVLAVAVSRRSVPPRPSRP